MGLFTTGQAISRVRKGTKAISREAYEKKLEEYKSVLDSYRENLNAYEMKLKTFDSSEEDHMAAVQVALDLTYIKEELDEIKTNQDLGTKKREEIFQRVMRLDNTIIDPIKKSSLENKNEIINHVDQLIEVVRKNHKGLKLALGFSLIMNVLSMGGLIFAILYILEIIWI